MNTVFLYSSCYFGRGYEFSLNVLVCIPVEGQKVAQRQRSPDVGIVAVHLWQYTEKSSKFYSISFQFTLLSNYRLNVFEQSYCLNWIFDIHFSHLMSQL